MSEKFSARGAQVFAYNGGAEVMLALATNATRAHEIARSLAYDDYNRKRVDQLEAEVTRLKRELTDERTRKMLKADMAGTKVAAALNELEEVANGVEDTTIAFSAGAGFTDRLIRSQDGVWKVNP